MSARIKNGFGVVYFIEIEPYGLIKIGYTSGNPAKRMVKSNVVGLLGERLAKSELCSLVCRGYIKGTRVTERCIHSRFSKSRYTGEWFSPDVDLVKFIEENGIKFDKRVCFKCKGTQSARLIKINRDWRNLLLSKFDSACTELNLTKEELGKIVCSAKLRERIKTSHSITIEESMSIFSRIEREVKKARRAKK